MRTTPIHLATEPEPFVLTNSRPREAAITMVNYVNHRNANVALLALNVRHPSMKAMAYSQR
jgi:hypothetical protein